MKIFQSSFTGTSSVYFSFYSYNIQQCSISRIATCTEGRFHWYWQNQYVLLNTQIHLLPSVTNENTDDVMIWYDMVLRMLVFIRHQTGVNHEHVSHGRLAQAGHWPSPEIMLLLSPAHCLEIIGGCSPCHLGQETLHTGTSPWPPSTSHFNWDRNCVPIILQGSWSWGFYAFFFTFYHLFWQNISHIPWKAPLCIALSVSACHKPANTDPPNTSFLLSNNVPTIYTTSSQHI